MGYAQRGVAAVAAAMVVVLVAGTAAQAAPDDELAPLAAAPAGTEVVKDRYIVMLKKAAPSAARAGLVDRARARGAAVRRQYTTLVNGFSATLSATALADVRRDSAVAYVEPVLVERIDGEQLSPTWGLDRIDQASRARNNIYRYPATGYGVRVYVTDTGVRRTHQEFNGPVIAGPDFVDDDNDPQDCHGHGTHVAGTVAGRTVGVAKEATVVALRISNCEGNGSTDDSVASLEWIAANHPAGTPGVVNRSIGLSGTSHAIENAVRALIEQRNIVMVSSAGNDNEDACDFSPGRLPAVLTVASVDVDDLRAASSNWGSCVDLFAPGVGVTSASNENDTATRVMSGTSMATPHVAGAAALFLQSNRSATVAQVHAALVNASTKDTVINPKTSPNRLLFVAPQRTEPQASLNTMFNNYGDNAGCADWSGADATQSVPLPSGKRAWFFADTFLNKPSERTGFFRSSLRNSIVIQSGSSLRTITGGNTCQERNLDLPFWDRYARTPFAEPESNAFFWPGDSMVVGSNVVKFLYRNVPQEPPWWTDTHSAFVTVPISELESGEPVFRNPTLIAPKYTYGSHPINWGLALVRVGELVYIYGAGIVNADNDRKPYLAKATPGNLTNPSSWQFYRGGGLWSGAGDQNAAAPISNMYVENGFSVAYLNGRYWLVQHEPDLNGGRIVAHPAAQPYEFTDNRVTLYNPPEGTRGPGNQYKFYYEARIHPGLGAAGRVIVSYNVNTSAVSVGCRSLAEHDGSIYRPRFLNVPLGKFDNTAASTSAPADQVPAIAPLANDNNWYDSWAPPQSTNKGCPPLNQPTTLAGTVNPDGTVALSWSNYGRDVWYWVESRDVTAGTGWTRPELWQVDTSFVDMPISVPEKQGHTFAWRIIPFAGGAEAPASNVVQRVVNVQPPNQVTGVSATRTGNGVITVQWNETTYPSNRVYYFIDYWNITRGQTEAQAARTAPIDPGTTSRSFVFADGDRIGFRVYARNVGGFSPGSAVVTAVA
jgi:subtilisin family serine protease